MNAGDTSRFTHGDPTADQFMPTGGAVLIAGIYLSDQENNVEQIVGDLEVPCGWKVVQKWCGIGRRAPSEKVERVTETTLDEAVPKFILLNRLLSAEMLDHYDFVIVCDDDIVLPKDFLMRYLDLVVRYDLALAQPARTHNSYIDHHFVEQLDGLTARRTRFVEIGPVFSVRKDCYPVIFPFDETSSMGWGFDFVWPCLIEGRGLRMGIIDATPVEHSMRKPVKNYVHGEADKSQRDYLLRTHHLSKGEAFRILESYA